MKTVDWTENSAAGANALATATKAAAASTRHAITLISASYSGAVAGGLLQVKKGADVIWERYIHNAADIEVAGGFRGDNNEAISAELAAGGIGITGRVSIGGNSE